MQISKYVCGGEGPQGEGKAEQVSKYLEETNFIGSWAALCVCVCMRANASENPRAHGANLIVKK